MAKKEVDQEIVDKVEEKVVDNLPKDSEPIVKIEEDIFKKIDGKTSYLNVHAGCVLKSEGQLVFMPYNHFRDGKFVQTH